MIPPATHDLGGRAGYGPVPHDPNEPPFHADWERHVFALLGPALGAAGTEPGEFRHALERLDPGDYFGKGYYGRWLAGFELLLEEHGVIDRGAVDRHLAAPASTGPAGRAAIAEGPDPSSLPPDEPAAAEGPRSVRRRVARAPRYQVGDRVMVRAIATAGHTRLPEYVAGKVGVIAKLHPAEVFPDSTAHGFGERPQHVYAVGFDAATLWGDDAEQGVTVHVDLYEPYLSAGETS